MEDDRSAKETPSTAGGPPPPPPPEPSDTTPASDPPSFQPSSQKPAQEPSEAQQSTGVGSGGGFAPEPADEWLQDSGDYSGFHDEEYPTTVAGYADESYADEDYNEPQKVRLAVSRIDPLSTLKLSFLVSVAVGIGIVVATASVWLMLDGMGVFTQIDDLLQSVAGDEAQIEVLEYFEFNKVISLATIVAVVDVLVLTVLATLGAVVYNLIASLIGGIHVTLTDE